MLSTGDVVKEYAHGISISNDDGPKDINPYDEDKVGDSTLAQMQGFVSHSFDATTRFNPRMSNGQSTGNLVQTNQRRQGSQDSFGLSEVEIEEKQLVSQPNVTQLNRNT